MYEDACNTRCVDGLPEMLQGNYVHISDNYHKCPWAETRGPGEGRWDVQLLGVLRLGCVPMNISFQVLACFGLREKNGTSAESSMVLPWHRRENALTARGVMSAGIRAQFEANAS